MDAVLWWSMVLERIMAQAGYACLSFQRGREEVLWVISPMPSSPMAVMFLKRELMTDAMVSIVS